MTLVDKALANITMSCCVFAFLAGPVNVRRRAQSRLESDRNVTLYNRRVLLREGRENSWSALGERLVGRLGHDQIEREVFLEVALGFESVRSRCRAVRQRGVVLLMKGVELLLGVLVCLFGEYALLLLLFRLLLLQC